MWYGILLDFNLCMLVFVILVNIGGNGVMMMMFVFYFIYKVGLLVM